MTSKPRNGISIGIDEAGRGCVIGPLVVAVVAANAADRRWFWSKDVRDSKLVPAHRRDALADAIKQRCWFQIKVSMPPAIDEAVRDRTRTLNGLELEQMAECLRDAMDAFGDRETYALVDAPSINAQGFRKKLFVASGWADMDRLRAEHHADTRNRTVGAASLVAKAERERLIAALKQDLGLDFGCGYCHDAKTIAHLKTVAPDAPHVRWTWATTKRVILPGGFTNDK
ncbi:hypothetical protein KJ781_02685 [Patescibacteria group bacterium]|nr:hypothetical protein [Patescibacteria group bacterium]MBU1448225.1 hypothetical protein [Patescibacteria group bacterium]MBU2613636.1 hypothetical protein [Patescibacteria group bacterium]